jgi:hypothetical protein
MITKLRRLAKVLSSSLVPPKICQACDQIRPVDLCKANAAHSWSNESTGQKDGAVLLPAKAILEATCLGRFA